MLIAQILFIQLNSCTGPLVFQVQRNNIQDSTLKWRAVHKIGCIGLYGVKYQQSTVFIVQASIYTCLMYQSIDNTHTVQT